MKKVNHTERAHAVLSASGSSRWLNCPGSVKLVEAAPPQQSSDAAEEGTAAHELAERVLLQQPSARYWIGREKFNGYDVTEEMADNVQMYVDEVIWRRNELKGELSVEERFDLSWIYPGMFGTNDACIRQHFGKLVVIDFKYGQGTGVEVKENTQLIYYALGAAWDKVNKRFDDYEEIELIVIQPRYEHPDGPIRSWTFPASDLPKWAKKLKIGAIETTKKDAELKDGAWCKWCAAAPTCPKLHTKSMQNAMVNFDNIPAVPDANTITDEQVAKIVKHKSEIETFLKKVKDYALEKLKRGEKIKGLKLVEGRGSRRWVDNEKAEQFLVENIGDAAFTKKLISVSQAEKHLRPANVSGLWLRQDGAPTVAHESDKREALMGTPQETFEKIEKPKEEFGLDDF